MLSRIQAHLAELYDLPPVADVGCFVCGPERLAEWVGEGALRRMEVLLVVEDERGVRVGLYLDPGVLERLRAQGPVCFESVQLATEGVSHFVYLSFREQNAERVSQLELELQAEVDKYAAGLLSARLTGRPGGAIRERSRTLRRRLYGGVRFLDAPDTAQGARYRLAHRAAARYAARLEARYVDRGELDQMVLELRRFYRMGARQKLVRTR